VAGSALVVAAEVATDVTGPALLETLYELGRIASLPPGADELEQARQYALGTLRLGMSTQSGLAGLAVTYAGFGLRLDYLADHAKRLAKATREDVAAAAARYLAPSRAATVVLGDADEVESSLAVLMPLTRVRSE
jgi:zinc protease